MTKPQELCVGDTVYVIREIGMERGVVYTITALPGDWDNAGGYLSQYYHLSDGIEDHYVADRFDLRKINKRVKE